MRSVKHTKFYKNTFWQYGLQIAKYLFPFITLPYLTRVLGPDVYAVRAYILAAMTFAQVFLDYGFTSYGTKAVAENSDNRERIQSETSCILYLRLLLCLVGGAAVALATAAVPIMAANPLYVLIAYVGICFKALLPDFVFQGLEDMGIITKRFVVSQAISTVLVFVLVHGAGDLLWVPALEGLASLVALLWSWGNVLHGRGLAFVRVGGAKMLDAFKTSSVFFLSNAATTIFTALTTFLIGVYVADPAEISYWSISMTAVSAIQSLYSPITNSLYPHMVVRRDFALVKRLLKLGMPAVLVGTAAFAGLSNVIMGLLGGESYLPGAYVIAMVSPVLLFSFPAMLLGFPVLAAVGRVRQLTASSVMSALFHVIGMFALVAGGEFTVANVAVLRCGTEAVLMCLRILFVYRFIRECRGKEVRRLWK